MAVIESKGNGYSLFNGEKMPSLPEYDKEKYPYAVLIRLGEKYRIILCGASLYAHLYTEDPVRYQIKLSAASTVAYSSFVNAGDIAEGGWGTFNEVDRAEDFTIVAATYTTVWTNHDIRKETDNSIYLAASEPISLDGMNVIEWDGDTEGLEAFPGDAKYFCVSSTTDVDVNKNCVFVTKRISVGDVIITQTTLTDGGGYWKASNRINYINTISEDYPTTGCFFITRDAQFLSIFAYYPIEYGHLTFSSNEAFSIATYSEEKNWDGTLYYSTDAVTWNEWDGIATLESGEHKGEHRIYMRGKGNTVIGGGARGKRWIFAALSIRCEGNIENLLDYEVVAAGNHPPMGEYCFGYLFYEWPLISAPELPATTLSKGCYRDMFAGSTLSAPVELPATALVDICYRAMFNNCENIKISEEQSDEYWKPYRIPLCGEGNMAETATQVMFTNTGGTFVGSPEINKTYYLAIPRSGGASIGRKFLMHKIFGNLAIEKVLNK